MAAKNTISHSLGIMALFTSLFVFAAPIPVDMTTGVWTITAFDTGGNDWSGSTLTFETQTAATDDWLLSGYYFWDNGSGSSGRENSQELCSWIVLLSYQVSNWFRPQAV